MARLLTPLEVGDFLLRHPLIPSQVPPMGLIVHDAGRKIVVFKKVTGTLIFTDATDLAAIIGLENQFPNGIPNAELTVVENNVVVASLPAIVQNAIKETMATVAGGVAAGVDFAGGVVVDAAVGVGKGAVAGSGYGTLFLLAGAGIVGFIAWKARLV